MRTNRYGNNFVVVQGGKTLEHIRDAFKKFAEGTRQKDRYKKDIDLLNTLSETAGYDVVIRQYTGHRHVPQKVNGKMEPLFISKTIKW